MPNRLTADKASAHDQPTASKASPSHAARPPERTTSAPMKPHRLNARPSRQERENGNFHAKQGVYF